MRRTNIYLEDETLVVLKHLATETGATVSDLVRQAIDLMLADRLAENAGWGQRLDALADRVRSRVPASITPDEIEADITLARTEVKPRRGGQP